MHEKAVQALADGFHDIYLSAVITGSQKSNPQSNQWNNQWNNQ
jgi:hypothetical protein